MPIYIAMAIAEIFGLVTASEYSYEKAPSGMRGVVQAMGAAECVSWCADGHGD